MDLQIAQLTIDSTNPLPLAQWWAQQLSGEIVTENGGFYVVVTVPGWTANLAFQQVPDPTPGKNKMHVDISSSDPRTAVAGFVAAGAVQVDTQEFEGFGWTVLTDPDGNLFCISGR